MSNRVLNLWIVFLFLASCFCANMDRAGAGPPGEGNPWEAAIAKMKASDRPSPPAKGGIVFVGSSSIRFWKLDQSFPDLPTLNRGFGGSQVADSVYFAEQIILPYEPRFVVVYAGDNDIAAGKSPKQVCMDYQQLVDKIHASLPKTQIAFIAIKPSIARWKLVGPMREANSLVKDFIEGDERLVYIDVDAPMIGNGGKPRIELFKKDGLHLNDKGYALWTDLVRPFLVKSAREK